ncbi:MAG: flagellar motor switch protein FliG [Acidobacteria bacterium]|nr:flagellar motor switch protein FliG [Acidobacteriota bacterium]MDA1234561.1 flagellar motor switch protein FliG [Acidobacteriota bacterium]
MISDSSNSNALLPGLRKAAIAMVTLGDEVASQVFRFLAEDEIQTLSGEISRISSVSSEQAQKVLEEFHELEMAHRQLSEGGLDYAKKVLNNAFGPDRAKVIVDRVLRSMGGEIPTFQMLQKADPQQAAKYIQDESPQTIALILSHLDSTAAAALLMALPAEIRGAVSMRMARLEQISPDVVGRIAAILEQRLRSLGQMRSEALGGIPAVAAMLNRMEANSGQELLQQIEETDGDLGFAIRNLMFVFDDMLLIDALGIREVLTRVDKKVLTIALKGTSENLRAHFFGNMSERGGAMLKEDMDMLGPIKIREVEAAQQEIIKIVRDLEAEGVVNLKATVGEQFVV